MNKKEDKTGFKTIYQVRYVKSTPLDRQLKWVEDRLSSKKKPFKTSQGEIREYAKNINVFGDHEKGKCIVLDNSLESAECSLICPIYPLESEKEMNKSGIKIGYIYELSDDKEYIAAIHEIRFIKKRRFYEYSINTKALGTIDVNTIDELIYYYHNLLDKVIQRMFKYEKVYTS
jgi:hypothetical protein